MANSRGKTAFAPTLMVEVPVQQPPKKAVPAHHQKLLQQIRKDAKGRIKSLRKEERRAKAGARMDKRRIRSSREQAAGLRRVGRQERKINKGEKRSQQQALRLVRARIRQHKQQIVLAKRAIRVHQKSMKPRVQRRLRAMVRAKVAKTFKWTAVIAKLKRIFKKKKAGDGRNHGFKGSGRGGRTGRAGYFR